MKHIARLGLLVSLLLTTSALAGPYSVPTADPYFTAMSPIFGYDPAYGTLLGVAWFSYPTGQVAEATARKDLNLVMRFGPHGAVSFQHQQPDWTPSFGLDYGLALNNFFNYTTEPSSTNIVSTAGHLQTEGFLRLRKPISQSWEWQLGPVASWRRHEEDGSSAQAHLAVRMIHDTRDNPINSQHGYYLAGTWRLQPDWTHSQQTEGSMQWAWDNRVFLSPVQNHVLAFRGLAETSVGPGLLSQLGGSELLRGYLGNTFEGDRMLALQGEYRFPVFAFVRGVAFYESGWVHADQDWKRPSSAGFGFRFGLPPDQSMSVRWDLAVNDNGEWQTFVNFNQVF